MAGEEIINLDSSSEEEDAPQVEIEENSNTVEQGEIQEEGLNEIEPGDDANVEDMDLGDDVVVAKQSVLSASAEVVASGPSSSTVIKSSTDIVFADQTRILFLC